MMMRSQVLLALILSSSVGLIATGSVAQQEAEYAQPPASQQSVANLITQSVVKLGAFSCAERVEQVTSYLGFGPDTLVTIRTPKQPANKRSLSVAMDVPSIASNAMAFADFYPVPTGCTATYHLTFSEQTNCEELAQQRFSELKTGRKLGDNLILLTNSMGMRVFLAQGDGMCLVTKTETLD